MSDSVFPSAFESMRKGFVSKNKTYERAFAQDMEQRKQMFDGWQKSTDDSIRQADRIEQRARAEKNREADRIDQEACAEVANVYNQPERYKIHFLDASHHLGALPEASPVVTNVSNGTLNPPSTPQGDLRLSPAPSTPPGMRDMDPLDDSAASPHRRQLRDRHDAYVGHEDSASEGDDDTMSTELDFHEAQLVNIENRTPDSFASEALDESLPEEEREHAPGHDPAMRPHGDTQTRDVPPTKASRSRDRSLEDGDGDNTSAGSANRSPSGEPSRGELLTDMTFDEVYHNTIYTDFKNIIVEWPKHSQQFYIVTCQVCRKNWGAAPLRSAGAHLRSSAHEMPGRRDSEAVIRQLGIRVTRCNIQVAHKNNEEYLHLLKNGQYRVPEHYSEVSSRASSG